MNIDSRLQRLERDFQAGDTEVSAFVIYDPKLGIPEREPGDERTLICIPYNGREPQQ